jgi:branched-chain amino acid transport system ATP-binding protein
MVAAFMSSLLQLNNVTRRFGGVVAVSDVSFSLNSGEICGLIGPNGAGKTTLVNLMSGVVKPNSGAIVFDGKRIDQMPTYQVARSGIARTHQIVQPFSAMTVLENVTAAALFGGQEASIASAKEAAWQALEKCGLQDLASTNALSLSLAHRKRLEFAKSLALKPRLLLLDEVNAGLNASELDKAIELIRQIASEGVTIILVEHLMRLVLNVCDRIVVLHQGQLIADETPAELVKNEKVITAYLGRRFTQTKVEGAQ